MTTCPQQSLSAFENAFAQALLAPAAGAGKGALCNQPAFAVYRNTVMKGCIDALEANFPAVVRLVGTEWFRAAAAVYVRGEPPCAPSLVEYGSTFPAFLAAFAPGAKLPYLPAVARLDRCWTEAHVAPDARVLAPAAIACMRPDQLAPLRLEPHPAARWAWFDDAPIYTIWSRNRSAADTAAALKWHGEGALVTRPRDAVLWWRIDAAGCAFLDRCAQGAAAEAAVQAALAVKPDADLAQLMATLLEAGAFARVTPAHCELLERRS